MPPPIKAAKRACVPDLPTYLPTYRDKIDEEVGSYQKASIQIHSEDRMDEYVLAYPISPHTNYIHAYILVNIPLFSLHTITLLPYSPLPQPLPHKPTYLQSHFHSPILIQRSDVSNTLPLYIYIKRLYLKHTGPDKKAPEYSNRNIAVERYSITVHTHTSIHPSIHTNFAHT